MTTQKEKEGDMPTSKEKQYMQSPGNVSCSICLDTVENAGERSTARLKCGHHFHLDCIGSAFNAKGAMQCPNCRQVEGGQWLFASGCYLQQHLLRSANADEGSSSYGMHLDRYDDRVNDTGRRLPHGINRQIPAVENDYSSSTTNRWQAMGSREVLNWNIPLDESERPLAPEMMEPPHVSGTYAQSSQPMVMHRPPRQGNIISNASPMLLEGPMLRQRIEESDPLFPYEMMAGLTSGHRHARNRGGGLNERGFAFNLLPPDFRAQGSHGNMEQQSLGSRFQDARFGYQAGGNTYNNTRRAGGAYMPWNPIEHEWESGIHYPDSNHRSFASHGYVNQAHRLHSLNRAMSSHSYDGQHQLGARVPWI